jgi:hypothetical protein
MSFQNVATDLRGTIEQVTAGLQAVNGDDASLRPAPGKWSKKEIIAHLIDSATNNHQRFVRAAMEGKVTFPGYDQDGLTALQKPNEADWQVIVELWRSYNLYLAHILQRLPESAAHNPCSIAGKPAVTLLWLAEDYVAHLKHHINQALGTKFTTSYGAKV